ETGGEVYSSPAIARDGGLYVGSEDNNLYAIDANGNLKWRYETGGGWWDYVDSSPAIAEDGTVFVGSYDNRVYAINSDGSLQWSFSTEGWIDSSPVIGSDGTVYVGSADSNLYAINTPSPGPTDSPWPMFRKDSKHTSRVKNH
ncbi:PQQ-like beta-propeller repeat protein, partial [Candidatus Bipolaricaulota bacterium]|nr:PQQ-like beta-propeller repeat protein [Candidatus Bipolaricaulota bacterium]